jgi:hypothetical protein
LELDRDGAESLCWGGAVAVVEGAVEAKEGSGACGVRAGKRLLYEAEEEPSFFPYPPLKFVEECGLTPRPMASSGSSSLLQLPSAFPPSPPTFFAEATDGSPAARDFLAFSIGLQFSLKIELELGRAAALIFAKSGRPPC